jgi:hypothetical protein
MPADIEACVAALSGKEGVDNPHALCNWMRSEKRGFFGSRSPDDPKEIAAAIKDYNGGAREQRQTVSERFRLTEAVHTGQVPADNVIREGDSITLRGVKLIGTKSRNPPPHDNEYPRETREALRKLMEGHTVRVDHAIVGPGGMSRSYKDRMGYTHNVRVEEDGNYGDWTFPSRHALAETAVWDALHSHRGCGFSIDGDGKKRRQDGRTIVESEGLSLYSIDLVDTPATTGGFWESERRTMLSTVGRIIEALKYRRPGYVRALREQVEAGVMTPEMPMEEPAEPMEPEPEEAADHEQAILDAAVAVLKDAALTAAEKIKKIKVLLKMTGNSMGGEEEEMEGETMEQRRTRRGNLLEHLLDRCAESGLVPSKTLRRACVSCKNTTEVDELIREQQTHTAQRPRSAGPPASGSAVREQQRGGAAAIPEDTKALGRWLTTPG